MASDFPVDPGKPGRIGRASPVFAAIPVTSLAATPTDVGVEEVAEWWPVFVRVGWFLAGFLGILIVGRLLVLPALSRAVRHRNRNNQTLNEAIRLYVQMGVLLLAVMVGATVAGYGGFLSDSALLISAVALAIGVAAQEVIGSLVSGLALVVDPEFNVGDYIEWEGGEGVVQAVALRITRVETRDGTLVTIPNTVLTSHEVTRPFGGNSYRVGEDIAISYQSDLQEAVAVIEDAASTVDEILDEPAPTAYIENFGDNAVLVRIHYWVDAERRNAPGVRSDYARTVKNRLDEAEIPMSPPSEHNLSGQLTVSNRP